MKRLLSILLSVFAIMTAASQIAPDSLRFYFVSVGPGRTFYELEGHSAITVVEPNGRAWAYNYGIFDFNSPNFLYRFVKGETDYMAVAYPWPRFLAQYAGTGRRIEMAELNLNSEAKARLIEQLNHDINPLYRTYRYNYVRNNCATRPLRAVEIAIGDSILFSPAPFEANSSEPMTFRNIMRHYHANYPWYQFGIDLALGMEVDLPITRREATFAPEELRLMLRNATVGGTALVSEFHEVQSESSNAIDEPTPWYLTPSAASILVFIITIAINTYDLKRKRISRWFDCIFYSIFGLAGLLLSYLIFVSVHEATTFNFLFLWLNPFCLIPVVTMWIKRAKKVFIRYHFINFVLLIAFGITWSFIPQSGNWAFLPLVAAEILRSASILNIIERREIEQ